MGKRLREERAPAPHALFYCREKSLTEVMSQLERVGTAPGPIGHLVRVLHENIEAAVRIAETPAVVALASGFPPAERASKLAAHDLVLRLGRAARTRETSAPSEDEAKDTLRAQVVLWQLAVAGEVELFVNEPLRQATVLLWAALEYAVNRVIAVILDKDPDRLCGEAEPASRLRAALSIGAKRRREFPEHGVGSWLENEKRVSSLRAMQAAVRALFPSAIALHEEFNADDLRKCAARRNLIAHRAGIVDANYCSESRDDAEIGTLLVVNAKMFTTQIASVTIAGAELVLQASLTLLGEAS